MSIRRGFFVLMLVFVVVSLGTVVISAQDAGNTITETTSAGTAESSSEDQFFLWRWIEEWIEEARSSSWGSFGEVGPAWAALKFMIIMLLFGAVAAPFAGNPSDDSRPGCLLAQAVAFIASFGSLTALFYLIRAIF